MMLASFGRILLRAAPLCALMAMPALAATEPTTIHVTLDNTGEQMVLKPDKSMVKAGPAEFVVTNKSADEEHEMIVIKTKMKPSELPMKDNGAYVDESKFKHAHEVSELKPGATGTLKEKLTPGHYILFCNIKNHFKDGMYSELTVTQ